MIGQQLWTIQWCLRFSDWPISIHNRVYIFHRVLSDHYSDVLYICCKIFAFFKAIFKFKKLLNYKKETYSFKEETNENCFFSCLKTKGKLDVIKYKVKY